MYRASSPPMLWAMTLTRSPGNSRSSVTSVPARSEIDAVGGTRG